MLSRNFANLHLDNQIGVWAMESLVLDQWINLSQGLFTWICFFLQVLTKICWSFCKLLGNWATNATTVQSESSHLLCYLVADESEFSRRPDGDQMASGGRQSQDRPSHGQYINFNSAIHICVHFFVYSWFVAALMWPFNACDTHVVLFHIVDTW